MTSLEHDQREPSPWRQALEAHLGSEKVSRVIYGSIIGLALVVSLEAHSAAAGSVVAALLATTVAVGLAELYSEIIGTATRLRRRISREQMLEIVEGIGAALFGIAFPAVFFLLTAAGVLDLHTAFTVAKWTGLGFLAGYGFCAARLAGATSGASLLHALAVGAIGGLLIVIKALVH